MHVDYVSQTCCCVHCTREGGSKSLVTVSFCPHTVQLGPGGGPPVGLSLVNPGSGPSVASKTVPFLKGLESSRKGTDSSQQEEGPFTDLESLLIGGGTAPPFLESLSTPLTPSFCLKLLRQSPFEPVSWKGPPRRALPVHFLRTRICKCRARAGLKLNFTVVSGNKG